LPLVTKTYRQIASDILTQITGGETSEEQLYAAGRIYELSNTPVAKITEVSGSSKGVRRIFIPEKDYMLRGDAVEWLDGGEHPDENAQFTVRYIFTRSSGISDLNPGSVVRTIVEALSRELEFLYLQTEQAYLAGFLDTAKGDSLDLVVSILGISRKPPQPSSGYICFGRNTEPEVLSVTNEVHLYDGSLEFQLKKPLAKEIAKVDGTSGGSPVVFEKNNDYTLAGKCVRWLPEGKKPDPRTVFHVDYNAHREIMIPKGTTVTNFASRPEDTRTFVTSDEASLTLNSEGRWEVDVPVLCAVPGNAGNILAGTITVMPQPIAGIEYVINKGDIINGVEAEEDTELRDRAKHALEFAGKATQASLESAIRSIEGVKSSFIEDMPDGVPGIVRVIVDGGDMEKITRAINETRAAGVKVEIFRAKIVYVTVSMTVNLIEEASSAWVSGEVEKRVRGYVSSLGIGDDVLYSKIIETVVGVDGVWDVRNVEIVAQRADGTIVQSDRENIELTTEERAEPRNISISFEGRK
jgi:uncharacterized phage protein gp47/JayE